MDTATPCVVVDGRCHGVAPSDEAAGPSARRAHRTRCLVLLWGCIAVLSVAALPRPPPAALQHLYMSAATGPRPSLGAVSRAPRQRLLSRARGTSRDVAHDRTALRLRPPTGPGLPPPALPHPAPRALAGPASSVSTTPLLLLLLAGAGAVSLAVRRWVDRRRRTVPALFRFLPPETPAPGPYQAMAAVQGHTGRHVRHSAAASDAAGAAAPATIVVIGGAGRVGGSAVRHLVEFGRAEGWAGRIVVAGRSEAKFRAARARWQRQCDPDARAALGAVEFADVDAADDASLDALLAGVEGGPALVVNAAGPFQGKRRSEPLEACLRHRVPRYVDVCDDIDLIQRCRAQHGPRARELGVTYVMAAGVWPGVSNLMAAECLAALDARGGPGGGRRATFDFYTAGTGGAGAAVLAATFLILAEDATVVRAGAAAGAPPYAPKPEALGGPRADFGPTVGRKPVFRMNLLEPVSCAEVFPSVTDAECFFGTDPPVWNSLIGATTRLVPRAVLANRGAMQALAAFSEPVVRAVDALVGDATNAMRVVVEDGAGGGRAEALYAHPNLEDCVGASVAAFCAHALAPRGGLPAGVLYPEELCVSGEDRAAVFARARRGCTEFTLPEV